MTALQPDPLAEHDLGGRRIVDYRVGDLGGGGQACWGSALTPRPYAYW